MKLTRNTTPDGKCKYAIVRLDKLRKLPEKFSKGSAEDALAVLSAHGLLEYGEPGSEEECFVIKLKDVNAPAALVAYSLSAAQNGDDEFANEIEALSDRAAAHPSRKRPD